jgi:hypothetical protein
VWVFVGVGCGCVEMEKTREELAKYLCVLECVCVEGGGVVILMYVAVLCLCGFVFLSVRQGGGGIVRSGTGSARVNARHVLDR